MIGWMYLKEFMLTKEMCQKNMILVIIGILKILVLSRKHIFAIVVIVQCKKLQILMIFLLFLLKEVIIGFIFGT